MVINQPNSKNAHRLVSRIINHQTRMAWLMLSAGSLMIALSVSIFVYGWWERSQLDNLVSTSSVSGPGSGSFLLISDRGDTIDNGAPVVESKDVDPVKTMIALAVMYPGENMPPALWSHPSGKEAINNVPLTFIDRYTGISLDNLPQRHTLATPKKIKIDSISLNAKIESLRILNLENSLAYETPNNVVGHIPESSNAGERGTAWFFGHLQSPIRGEGSVFSELPSIPILMRQGIPIYAEIDNGEFVFLYHLTSSEIVHGDDLELYEVGGPSIILVTCVPKLFYDHRLIVIGELVGIKKVG